MDTTQAAVKEAELRRALADCAKEPIHIPGSIQPHGFMLVFNADLVIEQISDNTDRFLSLATQELLGSTIDQVLDDETAPAVIALVKQSQQQHNPQGVVLTINGRRCDVVAHKTGDSIVVEFEPMLSEAESVSLYTMYSRLDYFTRRLQQASSIDEQCQIAAEEIHKLTGFARTKIYQFDEDWHGHVIAESRDEHMKSYLGHHFPASDIPKQARAMYVKNPLRLIADVDYTPATLVSAEKNAAPLDMSLSILRSVSPVHLQYLRHMHIAASMSVSILQGDKLWGLICCHHETPKYVSYSVRMIAQLIGEILALQISVLTTSQELEYKEKVQRSVSTVASRLRHHTNAQHIEDALPDMMRSIGAGGVTLQLDHQIYTSGNTPAKEESARIVSWLKEHHAQQVFSSHHLSLHMALSDETKAVASGILAVPIDRNTDDMMLWFRPEIIETIQWAGNPDQVKNLDASDRFLNPRQSFERWEQMVKDVAVPWQQVELEAAQQLADAVHTHQLDKALQETLSKERQEKLKHQNARERLRAIVDTTVDGLITINSEGEIVHYNKACETIFGYTTDEAIGSNVKMLMPEKYAKQHDDFLKKYKETGSANIIGVGRRVEGKRKDGSVFPLDLAVGEVHINNEVLYSGIVRDITETRKMEDALNKSFSALEEKNAEIENFAYIISHDFRAPLVNLKGFSKELQYSLDRLAEVTNNSDADIQSIIENDMATALRFINNGVDKLDVMTSAMLGLSRTGKRELALEPIDTNTLVDESIQALQHQIAEKGIAVTVHDLPAVMADDVSLQQIFGNILDNAVKYLDPARPGVIEVSAQKTDTETIFAIKDNGRGIDQKDMHRVFEIFRRIGVNDVPGEGMGMAYVKTLVERHGGTLWCESEVGRGTSFFFSVANNLAEHTTNRLEAA